jgi:hypothetical protein
LAAAVAAVFGSALPVTRKEQETLGSLGQQARDLISEQTDQVTAQVREKKNELLDKADAKLSQTNEPTDQPAGGQTMANEKPFIAGI